MQESEKARNFHKLGSTPTVLGILQEEGGMYGLDEMQPPVPPVRFGDRSDSFGVSSTGSGGRPKSVSFASDFDSDGEGARDLDDGFAMFSLDDT